MLAIQNRGLARSVLSTVSRHLSCSSTALTRIPTWKQRHPSRMETASRESSCLAAARSATPSSPSNQVQIDVPIRFEGKWERVKNSSNQVSRYDLLVEYKRINNPAVATGQSGESDHHPETPFSFPARNRKSNQIILSIERRSHTCPQYASALKKLKYKVGEKKESLSLLIDEENVARILGFDGEAKEIITIEQTNGQEQTPTVGFIGMEKGYAVAAGNSERSIRLQCLFFFVSSDSCLFEYSIRV